jgi:hypothetical protein
MKVNQRGTATILGIAAMAMVLLIIITGLILVNLSGKLIAKQLLYKGQAYNAAEAGLTNALTWFRVQSAQPVADDPTDDTDCFGFKPREDLSATPPVNETDDPSIGIVRDFSVSPLGSVRGRYLVMKEDINCDGTISSSEEGKGVVDRSEERGKDNPGRVWQVESVGVIYVDSDNGAAGNAKGDMDWDPAVDDKNGNGRPDAGEGEVLVTQTLRSDIQRLTTVLPGGAAIVAEGQTTISDKSRVRGISGIGVIYGPTATAPVPTGGAELSGTSPSSQADPFAGSIQEVFGVTEQELTNMADQKGTLDKIPNPLSAMQLIVINGNNGPVVFDSQRPLIGSGILIVLDGDLTITANSNANFNGFIYVRGTYSQNSPSLVSGTVMVVKKSDGTGGTASITGAGGDFSEIDYDPAIIQLGQNQLGQYRFSRAPYLVSLN